MDVNLTMLRGKVTVPPMVETDEDGSTSMRLLVLVRCSWRRRIDVIPVRVTDPPPEFLDDALLRGQRVRVLGTLTRRCTPGSGAGGLEVAATAIELDDEGAGEGG